jgi:hypothetical protein
MGYEKYGVPREHWVQNHKLLSGSGQGVVLNLVDLLIMIDFLEWFAFVFIIIDSQSS